MLKFISTICFSLFFAIGIFSQTAKQTETVIWQKYQIPDNEISVFLPKMPVVTQWVDVCTETETKIYWAYAEEIVYQVRISSKFKKGNRGTCEEKRNFGEEIFAQRINQIKRSSDSTDEIKLIQNKKEVTKINDKTFDYWIFNDLVNDKWVELGIAHRADVKPNEERFIKSLEFTENPTGIVIGDGAEKTLGDETAENAKNVSDKSDSNSGAEKTEPMIIISKPRAYYTEAARQSQTQGTVMLRVTFLASGGIGSVSVVKELTNGLTEQAIAAANKMVFLPQKVKGVNVSVTKQVQYSFTIY